MVDFIYVFCWSCGAKWAIPEGVAGWKFRCDKCNCHDEHQAKPAPDLREELCTSCHKPVEDKDGRCSNCLGLTKLAIDKHNASALREAVLSMIKNWDGRHNGYGYKLFIMEEELDKLKAIIKEK